MGHIAEAVGLLLDSIRLMSGSQPRQFFVVFVMGVALAGLCWFGCAHYTRLWNLRYRPSILHHVLCGTAALLTLIFTLAYASLGQASRVALNRIEAWNKQVRGNQKAQDEAYANVYFSIRDSGLEDFATANYPPPGHPDSMYPLTKEATMRLAARTYMEATLGNFRRAQPLLSEILWQRTDEPLETVLADRRQYLQLQRSNRNTPSYPTSRYFDIAASEIKKEINPRTPSVVGRARRWLALLFLVTQAFPFGLIGYGAYQDLGATR